MICEIKGTVAGVQDKVSRDKGTPYRLVQLLQQGERGAALVSVRLWNGQKVEIGKVVMFTVRVQAWRGQQGEALLSADVN